MFNHCKCPRGMLFLHFCTLIVCSAYMQKQIFGPRTAKSQPIWIKFCTHLLSYGIHLWALGWLQAKPKRLCFSVILVTHFVPWTEPDPKSSIFRIFKGTLWLSCSQRTGNSFTPNQWYCWIAETLKVCLLLVWRVCDQVFGRYRPMKGAEKWSCDHHENWKVVYRHTRKFHLFQKRYSFRSTTKNEVITEEPFPNSVIARQLWMDAWPSWIEAGSQYMFQV